MAKPKDLIKRIGGEFDSATLASVEAQERREAEMHRIAQHSTSVLRHAAAPAQGALRDLGLTCLGGLVLLFLISAL